MKKIIALCIVTVFCLFSLSSCGIVEGQLERSRENTDAANIRGIYAEIITEALTGKENLYYKAIELKQTKAGWQSSECIEGLKTTLNGFNGDVTISGEPVPGGWCEMYLWQNQTESASELEVYFVREISEGNRH